MKIVKRSLSKAIYKTNKYISEVIFPFTKTGNNLKALQDIHMSERCFIIGNGPSLTTEDLKRLKNEVTFAFNRIYYIFDQTDWRPTYYCSEDDKTILNSRDEIDSLKIENKFFPLNFPRDYKIQFRNAKYYIFKFSDKNVEPKFSNDIVKGIYWGNTVTYTAIQMAVYMGIKEIYLLGVDHNFSKMINDKGEIIIDKTAKDYFTKEYNTDKEDLYIPNVEVSTRSFKAAKKYADKNDIKIYNATRGGKLEVFERVDFDKIFFENERVTI
ncbi:6-hydroxymethylpterin diphosphokinase MptE-like protein [Metabacillus litoralis]|uniref:6-hydroxymethylpterin diphosphokinase MptE-like protein n=1 Tax=Metabacillus litoralis TaxID=152268 RepID=UPI000EF5B507|nr:6-hydroxymethylpterin diphosphokinase MptE-like protein [Metabacillus litoralis]